MVLLHICGELQNFILRILIVGNSETGGEWKHIIRRVDVGEEVFLRFYSMSELVKKMCQGVALHAPERREKSANTSIHRQCSVSHFSTKSLRFQGQKL